MRRGTGIRYGKGKDSGIFLQRVGVRVIQVDGAVPGLQGLEYYGGGACGKGFLQPRGPGESRRAAEACGLYQALSFVGNKLRGAGPDSNGF